MDDLRFEMISQMGQESVLGSTAEAMSLASVKDSEGWTEC
jgi:hypothetical protein